MTAAGAATLAEVIAGLSSTRRAVFFVSHEGVERLTYAEIEAATADLARRWRGLGVERGDRVMLVLASKREFVLAFLAAVRAGVVPVPVFPPERGGQVDLGTERALAVSHHCRERLVVASPSLTWLCAGTASGRAVTLADLAAAPAGPAGPAVDPDDVAFLQYTSGSTAAPRGVALSHRNVLANLWAIRDTLDVVADDVAVSWLPLYHDMGLIGFLLVPLLVELDLWHLGTAAFIQRPTMWMDLMTRAGGTIAYAPSFAYELLARRARPRHLEGWDLSAWRVAGCGAEPVRAAVLRRFGETMRPAGFDERALVPAYGLAEATLMVTNRPVGSGVHSIVIDPEALAADGGVRVLPGADGERGIEVASCGVPVAGTEVRVVHDGGGPGPRQGEVQVRGPAVARGYWNDPTGGGAFAGGWLRTGDLGFLYGGELYVTGRIKDLVIRNGSNYHPHDIERAFGRAAGLRPSHVVAFCGAGDELVVAVEGRTAGGDDLSAGARHVAATVGVSPDRVVFVPRGSLPKTSSGKLRRQELRRRFLAGEIEVVEAAGPGPAGSGP